VLPSRVAALSRRQRAYIPRRGSLASTAGLRPASRLPRVGGGVLGASRDSATPSTRSRLSMPSTPSTRHGIDAGEPWAGGFQKRKDAALARGLEGGVHRGSVGGLRRGARGRRRRRLGRRRRRGLVRWVDPARALCFVRSRVDGGCVAVPLGGGAATPSTREGSRRKRRTPATIRRLEGRVDGRRVARSMGRSRRWRHGGLVAGLVPVLSRSLSFVCFRRRGSLASAAELLGRPATAPSTPSTPRRPGHQLSSAGSRHVNSA
jgi:hypothetical protein